MRSLSAPNRWPATTATMAPPRPKAAAASELTASPTNSSSAATMLALRNTCEMLFMTPCAKSPNPKEPAALASSGTISALIGSPLPSSAVKA